MSELTTFFNSGKNRRLLYLSSFLVLSIVSGIIGVACLYWPSADTLFLLVWLAFFLICALGISMTDNYTLKAIPVVKLLIVMLVTLLIFWFAPWNGILTVFSVADYLSAFIVFAFSTGVMFLYVQLAIFTSVVALRGKSLKLNTINWMRLVVILLIATVAGTVLIFLGYYLLDTFVSSEEIVVFCDHFLTFVYCAIVAYLTVKELTSAQHSSENSI